jgi:dTDP-4-amino-4,6-dideoxygalactose transaminase
MLFLGDNMNNSLIPFNKPTIPPNVEFYIDDSIKSLAELNLYKYRNLSLDILEDYFHHNRLFLTSSCSQALLMASLILNLKLGDEVIVPSYSYITSASSFVLNGAKVVFCDVDKNFNLDTKHAMSLINKRTRAIVVVHYNSIRANMDELLIYSQDNNIFVIEDCAQCIGSKHNNRQLGYEGDISCFSFHHTKNINSGNCGGLLVINNSNLLEKAFEVYNTGTNRKDFLNGLVSSYSWTGLGLSSEINELGSAILYASLKELKNITERRKQIEKLYYEGLKDYFNLSTYVDNSNGHIFYILEKDKSSRDKLIEYLRNNGIVAQFHFQPLHLSAGAKNYSIITNCPNSIYLSDRIVRLPIFDAMKKEEVNYIIKTLKEYK